MGYTQDVIDRLNTQIQITATCHEILRDLKYMNTEESARNVMYSDPFFQRVSDFMWRILILEFIKLFDSEQDFCYNKNLNILINNYKAIEWMNEIKIEELQKIKDQLEKEVEGTIFKKVKTFRDKVVAHLDKNSEKITETFFLEEAQELCDYALEIHNTLTKALKGYPYIIDLESLGKVETTIRNMNELYVRREKQTNF